MNKPPRKGAGLLARRQLLQLGVTGVAALGTGGLPAAGAAQTPGSGQGRTAAAATPRIGAECRADAGRRLVGAVGLAPIGLAQPTARVERRRQRPPPASHVARQSIHAPFQFQRVKPRADDPDAGQRATSHHHAQSSRLEHGPGAKGASAGPIRGPSGSARARRSAACRRQAGRSCDTPPNETTIFGHFHEFFEGSPMVLVDTHCVTGHVNLPHGSHTTNLHTHGLHVHPGMNPNGTAGDNTFLRILPRDDARARQASSHAACRSVAAHERVAEAHYEFNWATCNDRNAVRPVAPQPHAPGTHWYHPHAHGSTHDQVASGLAGFLIVEGDVDDAINRAMTGTDRPDPCVKTGPVRLPRAADAHPARRGVLGRHRRRAETWPGTRRAAHGHQRELHANVDLHATRAPSSAGAC